MPTFQQKSTRHTKKQKNMAQRNKSPGKKQRSMIYLMMDFLKVTLRGHFLSTPALQGNQQNKESMNLKKIIKN